MQGLLNIAGGDAGMGRNSSSEQAAGSYHAKPAISTTYGSVYSTSSSYMPPSGPLPPSANSYAPSSYAQPSQSGSPFRPPIQSQYAPSHAQPPPSTTSFPNANSSHMHGAPGGYPAATLPGGYSPLGVPPTTGGYPPPIVPSPNIPPAGGYSTHRPHVGSYSAPSGPPPGGFGFPDDDQHQPSFPSPGGYPPRGEPYNRRW